MHYIIYKTTNLINGKYYIGKHKTKNLEDGYLGSGKLLKRAIKKYGIWNFHREILLECSSEEEMNLKEKELVMVSEETYNLCEGGKGGFGYINENKLNKISLSNLEVREKIKIAGIKGNKILHEKLKNNPLFKKAMYLKISEKNKGKKRSDETKIKMKLNSAHYFLGKKRSDQFINKISGENHWSKQPGKIHNSKINHPMKGRHHSEESKRKMSESAKLRKTKLKS